MKPQGRTTISSSQSKNGEQQHFVYFFRHVSYEKLKLQPTNVNEEQIGVEIDKKFKSYVTIIDCF